MKSNAPYLLLALLSDAVKEVLQVVVGVRLATNQADELPLSVGVALLSSNPCLHSAYLRIMLHNRHLTSL